MLSFLKGKMFNNKWLVASLIIGNVLLIGIVSSSPLYLQATLKRMLLKDMETYQVERNSYPGLIETTYQFSAVEQSRSVETYRDMRDNLHRRMVADYDIPVIMRIETISLQNWYFTPFVSREDRPRSRGLNMAAMSDFADHMSVTVGEMYADEMVDGVLTCVANQQTLDAQDILLGEVLECKDVMINDEPLKIKVVGVYINSEENDLYWTTSPANYNNRLVISDNLLRSLFLENYQPGFRMNASFQTIVDFRLMSTRDIEKYLETYAFYADYASKTRGMLRIRADFINVISGYGVQADKLNVTLWVMQVPVFILLAFFIFMVSKQILQIEQNDISVIKSRGASRRQIILVYFMQGVIISVISLLLGIPLGMLICRALGASNGFLNMVSRTALVVELNPECFMYSGLAALVSVMTMLIPVISHSRVTIVDYKRAKSGKRKRPVWQVFFLDVVLFLVSLYGLYSFDRQREIMAMTYTDVQSVDPLLFLSSSLFIIGLGLLCLRVFPLLVRLVFTIGKRRWSPAIFASFLKVVRSTGEEQFIMIFLIFTLAAGIFNAKAARTINLNSEDQIRYTIGADLTFQEKWDDNQKADMGPAMMGGVDLGGSQGPSQIVYREPDFERYTNLTEVVSAAKVLRDANVMVDVPQGRLDKVNLLAIESDSFGKTVWFRNDLFPAHFYDYLNVLAKEPRCVLLSSNFKEVYGYKVGDVINFRSAKNSYVSCIIYGFVDYWPGFSSYQRVKSSEGTVVERKNWLIVANLSYIQSIWNITPYEIWLQTSSGSNNFLYQYAEENLIKFARFSDSAAEITKSKNNPVLQGTNGVLTVGFITILMVCVTGFLIYWILSIKSRVLQFGIFRAMGMSMGGILRLLLNEQFFISVLAIAIGAGVGEIASRLFVPLIQISYTASEQVMPFLITTQTQDYVRLFTIIGVTVALCMGVLGVLISKIKIAQALKLGED